MTIAATQAREARFAKVRHELKLRSLVVRHVDHVTPAMLRVTLGGDDLSDFPSRGFDDHVKLLVPLPSGAIERRDYTPRRFSRKARTLTIDFAVHEAGPATRWALDARPGDRIEVGGPKGSSVISADILRLLLIGDETALPAIGRCIEEATHGVEITSLVAVTGAQEYQSFDTSAQLTAFWAHRPLSAAADPSALIAAADTLELLPDTFVWIAAEATVARAVRAYMVSERGQPLSWTKAAGYWVEGHADAHERIG